MSRHTIAIDTDTDDWRQFYVVAPCTEDDLPRIVGRFRTFGEAHRCAEAMDKELEREMVTHDTTR